MLGESIRTEQMWMTVQQPRLASFVPNSYLLLLSALDSGWTIQKIALLPSWDQHGMIYLVTLGRSGQEQTQQLILPQNSLVDTLLAEYAPHQPIRSAAD